MMQFRTKNKSISHRDYPDYIIVGLGNPKPVYDNTRHNVGFRAVDYLAEHGRDGVPCKRIKNNALVGKFVIAGYNFILAKPQTYMNLSGIAVKGLMDYYGLNSDKVIIIYDDVALPLGSIRIRQEGSSGGHNGVGSVMQYLDYQPFLRIRIGVGNKPPQWDLADYVLSQFTDAENKVLSEVFPKIHDALDCMLKYDVAKMMSEYNKTEKN